MKKQGRHLANKGLYIQSYSFSSSHIRMWELDRKKKLNSEELMPLNYSAGKDSWESLEQQGYQISHSSRKSTLNTHWKNWCWTWSFNTWAIWWEELKHWKRPCWWETLKAGGEGDNIEWDSWIDMSLSELREIVKNREDWHAAVHGVTKSQTGLSYWSTTTTIKLPLHLSGEFVISSVLSCHNRNLKWTSITSLGWSSVTAPCYSSVIFRK